MMEFRIVTTLLLAIISFSSTWGQTILADEENESSILNIPNSVGLDVTDEKLTFNLNNIYSQRSTDQKWLFGVQYIGGNDNKESRLFNKGKFVFGNEISGFVSYSWVKKSDLQKSAERTRILLENKYIDTEENILEPIVRLVEKRYQQVKSNSRLDGQEMAAVEWYLFEDIYPVTVDNILRWKFLDYSKRFLNDEKTELKNTSYRAELEQIGLDSKEIDMFRDQFLIPILDYYKTENMENNLVWYFTNDKNKTLCQARKNVEKIERTYGINRHYIYIKGGLNGVNFTGIETINDSSYFNDTKFRGRFVEFGYNILIRGKYYVGASYQLDYTSNFNDLSQSSFSFSRTDSIGGTAYETKSERSAFLGTFHRFPRQVLKMDFAIRHPFKDQSTLIQGPYIRAIFQEDENRDLKNDFRVGWGVNFHKNNGKSIFGIFLELPEAAEGENEAGQKPWQRLSFGFRANYAFSGLPGL